jgi:hypothetical protein
MQRRLALTLAGSGALVLAAGTAAVAANLGILGAGSTGDPVGDLDAGNVVELIAEASTTTVPGEPEVVYVDEYVTVPATSAPPATAAPAPPAPVIVAPAAPGSGSTPATAAAPRVSDDHDDDHDDVEEHDDEHDEVDDHDDD